MYVAFIIDVFSRMIVGWQVSNSLRSDLAIDALEMAVWNRTRQGQVLDGLVHHSDRGVKADSTGRRNTSITEVCDGTWQEAVARGADRCPAPVGSGPGTTRTDAFTRAA